MKSAPKLFVLATLCAVVAPRAHAAGTMPPFFTEVVCLVMVSAAMAFLCYRLGLVPILGFLFTGVVLNATGLVRDPHLIEAMAEVGVILLLFTIGIEFSIESLVRIRRLIFGGGGLQVGLTVGGVTGILMALGTDWRASLFTGMLVALSSTAIVLKLLESRGETRGEPGQMAVGMLIFQDLAVVGMVIAVPLLGTSATDTSGLEKLGSLALAVTAVGVALIIARRLVPKLLEALARTCSPEIFLLGVIAICLGTAFLTGFAGISLSLGAFLAGLLVSESRFGSQALGEILPLQILFSATFFVSVGLLLDVGFLVRNLGMVLTVVVAVLLLKALVTTLSARLLGFAMGPALATGLLLAQVGEFAFVLERAGREAGLSPAGLGEAGGQTFIASSVLLMAMTPFLAQLGTALSRRQRARAIAAAFHDTATASSSAETPEHDLHDHVLVLGYGRSGRWLSDRLHSEGIPVLVITLSPTGATEAETKGIPVLRGDYTRHHLLAEGHLDRARIIVIADDTVEMAERALQIVRAKAEHVPVLVKATFEDDARALSGHGAAWVVSEEAHSHHALLDHIRRAFPDHAVETTREIEEIAAMPTADDPADNQAGARVLNLSAAQRQTTRCTHVEQTRSVSPEACDICPACVSSGDRWVHLRVCMTCGHVGCCDSSKNQHARRHTESSGHPIIRSIEPGETWAWCFEDETML